MMLKVRAPKIGIFGASKEAENKSGIVEGYLFNGYSKRKLYCLAETYEELAKLYRGIPDEAGICDDRKDMLLSSFCFFTYVSSDTYLESCSLSCGVSSIDGVRSSVCFIAWLLLGSAFIFWEIER